MCGCVPAKFLCPSGSSTIIVINFGPITLPAMAATQKHCAEYSSACLARGGHSKMISARPVGRKKQTRRSLDIKSLNSQYWLVIHYSRTCTEDHVLDCASFKTANCEGQECSVRISSDIYFGRFECEACWRQSLKPGLIVRDVCFDFPTSRKFFGLISRNTRWHCVLLRECHV